MSRKVGDGSETLSSPDLRRLLTKYWHHCVTPPPGFKLAVGSRQKGNKRGRSQAHVKGGGFEK